MKKVLLAWFLLLGTSACQSSKPPLLQGDFFTGAQAPPPAALQSLFENLQKSLNPQETAPPQIPELPPQVANKQNPFQLQLWHEGELVSRKLSAGGPLTKQLTTLSKTAYKKYAKAAPAPGSRNFVQLSLAYDFQPWRKGNFSKRNRELRDSWGLWGLVLQEESKNRWYYPSDFLEKNLKYSDFFQEICGTGKRPSECVASWGDRAHTFQVMDFLGTAKPPYFESLMRMAPVVSIEAITPEGVKARLALMREWYLNNLAANGKMTYLYRPAITKISTQHNNMIRQWMTTLALFRLGHYLSDAKLLEAAERNLAFNVKTYLKRDPETGMAYVFFRDKAKLGAAAFALMSVLESKTIPDRDSLIQEISRLILHLQLKDGSFKTFLLPERRNDNQNFYPGEALLALMTLYQSDPPGQAKLLPVVGSAFVYYRDFFRKSPNPAFVPWHTMALYRYYQVTKNREVADFIFEMNDFLLEIQNTPQSIKTDQSDTLGRFFDPNKRQYGPPHASSTAVYTEGLADAYRLASELGDAKRVHAYAYGIQWGLRSLFQLQFIPESSFYLKNLPAVLGGVRTTVNNSNIRVDNTQHSTMAFLNFLATEDSGQTLLNEAKTP